MSLWLESLSGPPPSYIIFDLELRRVGEFIFDEIDDDLYLSSIDGLLPDTEYLFFEESALELDRPAGSFRTLPEQGGTLRLAIGADIHPESAPYLAFHEIALREPHLFLGLGDHVYADLDPGGPIPPTEAAHRALYRRTWDDEALHTCWSNTASVLVWDDHEVWNDFDAATDRARAAAAADAYQRYQRSRSPSRDPWIVFDAGPAEIFILDTRTYRDANHAPAGPQKTMIGAAQKAALFDWLERAEAPFKLIASPTPFHHYADTGEDAWAHGFLHERDEIFGAIDRADPERIILLSGDQHWPAVIEHTLPSGAPILELMCTPTAAFTRPPPDPGALGDDALYIGGGELGFGWLEIEGGGAIRFQWINEHGETRYALDR